MPVSHNKQQTLAVAVPALRKKFTVPPEPEARPVLDEVLYAILREGATSAQADAAYAKLKHTFFDLNEIRVSSVQEVADALGDLPDAGVKGQRVVSVLQDVFEERYSFDLNDVAKKGLKQGGKQLARYKGGVTDFVVAWVTQRSFGGHAVPLDAPTLRVLYRLGVVEDEKPEDLEAARASIEHFVPKAKDFEFTELFVQHALTICTPGVPDCPHCPLKADCPTGQELLAKAKEAAKDAKPKSKPR